jgi:hypothetical protein
MPNISDECREHLREIDRRLQMISSAAAQESRVGVAVQTAIVNAKRAIAGVGGEDDDCREILRGLDPKLADINRAVLANHGYETIHRLVEEARASLRPGGMSGGAAVPGHG